MLAELHSVHPRVSAGGGWASYQIFKKKKKKGEGLTGSQFLEGCYWEKGGWLFSGGCSFYMKKKLKFEGGLRKTNV